MNYSLHTCLNVVQPRFYNNWEGWLSGPCSDGQSLGDLLALARWKTQSLFNDAATNPAYDRAIAQLAHDTVSGDSVLLHHSHHGGRRDNGLFGGGYHETFCLSDGEMTDTHWVEQLAQFGEGVNVIAVLDCCHAGGMDKSASGDCRPKRRPEFLTPKMASFPTIRAMERVKCNLIILPACRATETSVETMITEIAEVRGVWTWAFVRELLAQRNAQGRILLPDLYESARKYCAEQFPAQHPRVIKMGRNPEIAWQTRIV